MVSRSHMKPKVQNVTRNLVDYKKYLQNQDTHFTLTNEMQLCGITIKPFFHCLSYQRLDREFGFYSVERSGNLLPSLSKSYGNYLGSWPWSCQDCNQKQCQNLDRRALLSHLMQPIDTFSWVSQSQWVFVLLISITHISVSITYNSKMVGLIARSSFDTTITLFLSLNYLIFEL